MDREQLTAYSCGGSAGFSRHRRDSPASLLATKSWDKADRDGYMSCYSRRSVNGSFQGAIACLWKEIKAIAPAADPRRLPGFTIANVARHIDAVNESKRRRKNSFVQRVAMRRARPNSMSSSKPSRQWMLTLFRSRSRSKHRDETSDRARPETAFGLPDLDQS